jgi:sterol O-acyltransferase
MKMHAYMREKVMWYQYNGEHSSKPQTSSYLPLLGLPIPEYSYLTKEVEKYFYFLFAPTLIYRDEYPRTSRVRWHVVFFYLLQAVGIIYYAFLIFRELLPEFRSTKGQPTSVAQIIRQGFSCMGPAMTCMFFTHFLVLHLVQNLFAEFTRFADRKFYGDWWNSRTYTVFYRKWNGVVHDFIHSYVYSDLVQFCKFSRLAALLSAFIISAIVHEYLICIAMGFFLPILGILFTGPGLIFILLTKNATGRAWNIFMWITLSTGNAILMVLYVREFFARSIQPDKTFDYDFFIPRTYRIQFSLNNV